LCKVDICFEAGTINQFPGLKPLYKDYSYCHDTFSVFEPGGSYVFFYSEDSLIMIWYGVYGPPDYTHYLEKFIGIRIPNTSYVWIKSYTPKGNISVYPNPATDILYINMPEDMGETEIEIVDFTGKTIFKTRVWSSDYNINTSLFKSGFYVIICKKDGILYKTPFLVSR